VSVSGTLAPIPVRGLKSEFMFESTVSGNDDSNSKKKKR